VLAAAMLLWKSTSEKDKYDENNNISNTHTIHCIRLGTQYGSIKQRDSGLSPKLQMPWDGPYTTVQSVSHRLLI